MGNAPTVVRLRVKLGCREFSRSRKAFRAWFLVDIEGSDVCAFIDGHRTVPDKLLVLRIVLERHVRLEKPVDQFFLLILSVYAAQSSC